MAKSSLEDSEQFSPAEREFNQYIADVEAGVAQGPDEYLERLPTEADRVEFQNLVEESPALLVFGDLPEHDEPEPLSKTKPRVPPPNADGSWNLAPGQVIGDYELLSFLGAGGQGPVWEATHRSMGKHAALKFLSPGQGHSVRALNRFRAEAKAAARISHQNVVSILDYGEIDETPYIAQELVPEGRTLRDLIEEFRRVRDPSPEHYRRVAWFFARVASAIQAAHESDVIHRDVKPQNILVTPEGEPKIADFGMAKISTEASLSRTGDFLGTYYYMSPEQAMTKRMGDIDHRTDIFSLGVTFYEVLTLRRPFEGDTSQQITEKVMYVDPQDPRLVRSRVPEDLAVICLKALEKRRADRYQSMRAFADDLRRYRADEPIQARPPGAIALLLKWSRRHPVTVVMSIAVVSISVLLWVALSQNAELKESQHDLIVSRDEAERLNYQLSLQGVRHAMAIGDPKESQAWLAECEKERRDWEWHHLARLNDSSRFAVGAAHEGGVSALLFHPDGRLLVSAGSTDMTPSLWNAEQGRLHQRLEGHENIINSMAMGAGGRLVATATGSWLADEHVVKVWETETGIQVDHVPHEADVLAVAIAPGGLLVSGAADGSLLVWSTSLHTREWLAEPSRAAITTVAVSPDGAFILTGDDDHVVRVWSMADQAQTASFEGHESPITLVTFDDSGRRILSASEDAQVYLSGLRPDGTLDPDDQQAVSFVEETVHAALAYTSDLSLVAHGLDDGTAEIWRRGDDGARLRTAQGDDQPVSALAFDASGRRLAVGQDHGSVHVWGVVDEGVRQLGTYTGHVDLVNSLCFDADSGQLAAGARDGQLRVWDVIDRPPHTLNVGGGLAGYVNALAYSPDGRYLVSASGNPFTNEEGTVVLWDAQSGAYLDRVLDTHYPVFSLAFSRDSRRIAFGSDDGELRMWDVVIRGTPISWHAHDSAIRAVDFSADNTRVVSADENGHVRVWLTEDLTPVGEWTHDEGSVLAVRFSDDGRYLAVARKGGVELLNAGSLSPIETLTLKHEGAQDSMVRAIAFNRHTTELAAGYGNGVLGVWSLLNNQPRLELEAVEDSINSLAFNRACSRIVAGSDDDSVRIWDADSGAEYLSVHRGDADVKAVAWHPDGGAIATGSRDKALRLWFGPERPEEDDARER